MRRFAKLYEQLDSTTSTNSKIDAMVSYFLEADAADAIWVLYFLTGQRLKRLISSRDLREWTLRLTKIPLWLMEESYASVGDTAECCALLIRSQRMHLKANTKSPEVPLHLWMQNRILPLATLEQEQRCAQVLAWWDALDGYEIFILNKLLTGAFRVGVSQTLVVRALAKLSELRGTPLTTAELSHRLMGNWQPTPATFENLFLAGPAHLIQSKPYPFFLAAPLEKEVAELGSPSDWQAEWKWDGIRAQLIRRGNEVHIWSRGEELLTERFPEISTAAVMLPAGCVLDGEILAFRDEHVLPFAVLQKRIGRKKLSKAVLEAAPVAFMAYDLLEEKDEDIRQLPIVERRARLEHLLKNVTRVFHLSPLLSFKDWNELATLRKESRARDVEGIMLKRKDSSYQVGRKRGDWWKWKIEPFTVDAVLLYAQAGSGRRANLFTDYTFAVWQNKELVPVAKAYSGLDDQEIVRLDQWIRSHTKERFGPVRSVELEQVFELAFEGIAESSRHKAGIALRFPRILRWRFDKKPTDADSVDSLRRLLR